MKFITVCVIVCAIALNLSSLCAKLQRRSRGAVKITHFMEDELKKEEEETFNPATWRSDLHKQYIALVERINATWLKCNEVFSQPQYKVDMFAVSDTDVRKCMADCTLRLMGVVQNDDNDPTQYVTVINELRNNYTSFDITDEDCFLLDVDNDWTLETVYPDMCHILYAHDANDCIDLEDPYGDSCQSSWMVLGCMVGKHRKKFLKSPFYPILEDTRRFNESVRPSLV